MIKGGQVITLADTDHAKDKLQDILSKEEYQVYYEDNRNFLKIWWDRFVGWLEEQLSDLFPALESTGGAANIILVLIILVVLALIGLLVFLLVRRTRRRSTFQDHQPLERLAEKDWSYREHFEKALKLETNEEYTEATRHLFLAVLLYFHEKEWLVARRWKTNWEYVAELKQVNQQEAEAFYRLALLFDETVYGERTLKKHEFLHYRNEAMRWLQADNDDTGS